MAIPLQSSNLFASIDMGTNSFKLLIVHFEPTTAKFTTLHHQSDAVVLGRDSSSSSPSSPASISRDSQFRAIESLTKFQAILRSCNVTVTRVVGTSAIREACNRGVFLEEVRKKLGFDFQVNVLSGFEEARLIYLGVLQFFPFYDKKVLALDIGGGSTEFVIGDHGEVVYAESLRLGHVTLTQKFMEGDLVELRSYVRGQIDASGLVGKVKEMGFEVAIGSSGTIRAIEKAIWCGYGCDEWESLRSRGEVRERKWWWFSRVELRDLVERLCRGQFSERERIRRDGFFGQRSEFIVAGAVLLEEIMELLGISEMQVSGYALGEGLVAEMVSEAFPGCDLNANVRWKSVVRFAMRFNGKDRMKNGAQCAAIAKDIFEGLRNCNKVVQNQSTVGICLHDKDLEYLEAACMLHSIGLYNGKKGYHKRSYSIIREHSQLDGYSTEEIELIAQLARHHRKKFPRFELPSLQGFSGKKYKSLKLKEINVCHSHEGFKVALVEENQPLLSDSEKSIAKDIETKIREEAELIEVILDQKFSVVVHTGCLKSSTGK